MSNYKNNKKIKQIFSLFSINIVGIPLGIVTSILLTRFLEPKSFGDYSLIMSIINFAIVLGTFGFFFSSNNAIVNSNNKKEISEYHGTILIVSIFLFVIIYSAIIVYSLFDSNLYDKGIREEFLIVSPFLIISFILIKYYEVLLQASNSIKLLGQTRFFLKVFYIVFILLFYFFIRDKIDNKLLLVFTGFIISQLIVFLIVLKKLPISFSNYKLRLQKLLDYNKTLGLKIYFGSIFSIGVASLTNILISYFDVDNSGVGYYSLALSIASPLLFIPNTVGTTNFKEFSNSKEISSKVLFTTIGVTLIALLMSWFMIVPFIKIFYGESFSKVIILFYILSIGIALKGLADLYNNFLWSHGKGVELRNSSILVGISLFISSIVLIPRWSEVGAAISTSIGGLVYILSIKYYYNKFVKKISEE